MSSSRVISLLLPVAFLGLLHCSSDEGGSSSSSSGGAVPVVATRDEFVAAYCNLLEPCCKQYVDGVCSKSANGILTRGDFDAPAANRCLTRLQARAKASKLCGANAFLTSEPECLDVTSLKARGSVAVGKACFQVLFSAECVKPADGNVACVGAGTDTMCQHVTLATKEGDACAGDSLDDGRLPKGGSVQKLAAEGAYCDRSAGLVCTLDGTTDYRCKKRGQVGDTCDFSAPCAAGNWCDADTSKCAAKVVAGQPCKDPEACADGAACDEDTEKCSPTGDYLFEAGYCHTQ